MIIDFFKLLLLMLPVSLRDGLYYLVEPISSPIQVLYADFQTWQNDIRLQAATTCQVMYIETMLNYRLLGSFLRVIYITDGDGTNTDFIINVPGSVYVDYNRLNALVNKYKLYGKRFTVGQSTFSFDVEWTDMLCEIAEAYNHIYLMMLNEGAFITAISTYDVDSDLVILARVTTTYGFEDVHLEIVKGTNSFPNTYGGISGDILSLKIISVSPTSDSKYTYSFD